MKYLMVLACAVLVTGTAFAADHGPVFSYATPVNSERELSFDTGIFGRNGSQRDTALYGFRVRLWRHSSHHRQRIPPGFVWERQSAGKPHHERKRMVCRGIVAIPAFRYKCRKADRIDCLTRSGGSRPSAGLWCAWQPAPGTGGCWHARYGPGLSQSVRVGWGRLYPLCRGIERQTTGHTLLECRLWLSSVPSSPWIRPVGLSRLCRTHRGAHGCGSFKRRHPTR